MLIDTASPVIGFPCLPYELDNKLNKMYDPKLSTNFQILKKDSVRLSYAEGSSIAGDTIIDNIESNFLFYKINKFSN